MKIEDVKIGMKVVPHDKTASGWSSFAEWRNDKHEPAQFFSEHGFLYVKQHDEDEDAFSLCADPEGRGGGDFFRASDFTPAEIEVGDEVRVGDVLMGGSSWVARYNGKIGIVEDTAPDMLGVRMPDDGYVAATRAVATIVRKAHCIKPEAAKEPAPKAPETVRLETNAAGGTQSAIGWSIREYVAPSLRRVAAVAKHGLETYGEGNYAKIPRMDNLEHAVRHITIAIEESQGLPIPPEERGEDHLAHAVCRLMMAMTTETKEVLFDA